MSLTLPTHFSCPYCMAPNDVEVDEANDIDQEQTVDCQVCCSPITLTVTTNFNDDIELRVEQENG